jgi:HSP20 family protein
MKESAIMKDDRFQNGSLETEGESTCSTACEYSPRIDVLETTDEFRVEVELPGARQQDVDVELENGILKIKGRVAPRDESGLRVRVREFGSGDFARILRLGDSIDSGQITAEMKDGLLTLRLPKLGVLKPRSIPVISAN